MRHGLGSVLVRSALLLVAFAGTLSFVGCGGEEKAPATAQGGAPQDKDEETRNKAMEDFMSKQQAK